jgi:hypothetical protein
MEKRSSLVQRCVVVVNSEVAGLRAILIFTLGPLG